MAAIPNPPHLLNQARDLAMDQLYPRMNPVHAGAAPVGSNYVENARLRSLIADNVGTANDRRLFKLHLHTVEHQSMGNPGFHNISY